MFRNLLFILLLSIVVISCQKELSGEYGIIPNPSSPSSSKNLTGTWKFTGMSALSSTESLLDFGGMTTKTISRPDFRTIQNTGTITFSANGKATTNNLGYAVDTTAWVITYIDGVLFDSTEFDFVLPYTSSSGTSDYSFKGADSITFKNGSLAGSQDGTMGYKLTGNKLQFSILIKRDSTISMPGASGYVKTSQLNYINFEK